MPENQSKAAKRKRRIAEVFGPLLVIVLSPVLLVILIAALIAFLFTWAVLRLLIIALWAPLRRRALIVYSDSPHWQDYFERELLPGARVKVAVLNWSRRKTWKSGLTVWLFKFYGGSEEFNPLVIVVRPFGRICVIRFWQAYRDARHGRPEELNRVKAEAVEALEAG